MLVLALCLVLNVVQFGFYGRQVTREKGLGVYSVCPALTIIAGIFAELVA